MTGEISIRGKVKPVGGVVAKVEAAKLAGIKKVLIPKENWQELFDGMDIEIIPVEDISQVLDITFNRDVKKQDKISIQSHAVNMLTASGALGKAIER